MDRLTKFNELAKHAWFGKYYRKLSKGDIAIAIDFINKNADADKCVFEMRVSRMFLDMPDKPKRWQIIQELLANANT